MSQSALAVHPRNHEIVLGDNEFIVSKTDLKGRITYANRVFMRISGYPEHELLGEPHNLVRHPDMPRGAFYLLWKALQQEQEFFAFVKNLCADGSYYWVFANITPDYDASGKLMGYYSVRRKPSEAAIKTIEPIYKEMLEIERKSSASAAPAQSAEWLLDKIKRMKNDYEGFILDLQRTT